MIALLIKIRKRTWLPLKWWWKDRQELKVTKVRSVKEIKGLIKKMRKEMLEAERMNDLEAAENYRQNIETLNWVLIK